MRSAHVIKTALIGSLGLICSCGGAFGNLTASLGGDTAGRRGFLQVVVINNTPHRALLTLGAYDQLDQSFEPDFAQFAAEEDSLSLEGGASSDVITLVCGRVFGVGSPQLLQLIETNLPDATIDRSASVEGVLFVEVPIESAARRMSSPEKDWGHAMAKSVHGERSQTTFATIGTAPPFEALLGIDYPCDSLLVIRLEFDDFGPDAFRIDFEFIPNTPAR